MTRLHPEDLRAIVAATLAGSSRAAGCTWDFSIRAADALLAELARTAKPEPELATGCHRSHPHEDDLECPGNLAFKHGKAEGAREERERIIGIITDPHNEILWIVPGTSRVQAIHADPRRIRAALEPWPKEQP